MQLETRARLPLRLLQHDLDRRVHVAPGRFECLDALRRVGEARVSHLRQLRLVLRLGVLFLRVQKCFKSLSELRPRRRLALV